MKQSEMVMKPFPKNHSKITDNKTEHLKSSKLYRISWRTFPPKPSVCTNLGLVRHHFEKHFAGLLGLFDNSCKKYAIPFDACYLTLVRIRFKHDRKKYGAFRSINSITQFPIAMHRFLVRFYFFHVK